MGFLIHSVDDGHVPAFEYFPQNGMFIELGVAAIVRNNGISPTGGTVKPTHICMYQSNEPSNDYIPAIRADSGIVFETTVSAAATSLKLGDKVTLNGDGTGVTATTTDGVAEIVYIGGTAAGSVVRVRF